MTEQTKEKESFTPAGENRQSVRCKDPSITTKDLTVGISLMVGLFLEIVKDPAIKVKMDTYLQRQDPDNMNRLKKILKEFKIKRRGVKLY